MRRTIAPVLLVLAVLVLTGCRVTSQDDETTEPTPPKQSQQEPSTPAPAVLPGRLPVGHGDIGRADLVWAQGSVLYRPRAKPVNLAPLSVDGFVVATGGVYFLSRGELWFTDLVRARPTGATGVSALMAADGGAAVRVTGGTPSRTRAYSTVTGSVVPLASAPPVTVEDRQGRPITASLRSGRSDPPSAGPPQQARAGPGPFGVVGDESHPMVAFRLSTSVRVPMEVTVGSGFELLRWVSGTRFYGLVLDLEGGRPQLVVACDVRAGRCTDRGLVVPGQPLVFESGT